MATLFGHSVRVEMLVLYLGETLACFLALSILLAWGADVRPERAVAVAALVALCSGVISGASGLYQPEAWSRGRRLLARVAVAGGLLLVAWPALRAIGLGALDGHVAVVLAGFATALLVTRLGAAAAVRRGLLRQRIVVVRAPGPAAATPAAPGPAAPGPAGAAERPDDTFEVVANLSPGPGLAEALAPDRLLAARVGAVVAADPAALPDGLCRGCAAAGIRVYGAAEFRESRLARVDVDALAPGWAAATRAARQSRAEVAIHRALDVGTALALLLLTLPLTLLTALAVKLDSRGPVFYRQERVGRGGRVFTLYKFRSMAADAEAAGRPVWAARRDPRVTRVGRLIRLTRVDEIPQVLNVLRGDMAFVGPRPERPAFVAELRRLIPHYDDRALVRPGITGWAQVNYPYGASVEDARMKLAYDLYYVRRRSLFLDLIILVSTVRVVLFQEGSR